MSSGVRHRKLKVDAYRRAHKLLRIANRKFRKEKDAIVAMAMMQKDEVEEEDEDQKEEDRLARIDKNKEWRRRREMQKWESCGLEPPPDPKKEKERNRKIARKFEKQLCNEMLCSQCRNQLIGEVWECLDGHPTCGDCFDKKNMGVELESENMNSNSSERSDLVEILGSIKSRKLSSNSRTRSIDTMKKSLSTTSVATLASIETIASLRETLADIAEGDEDEDTKSWMKYRVNEIDFFLDTLEVRKDAISCYMDYNNEFKSIFYNPDVEGLSLHEDSNIDIHKNEYKDEKSERVLKYIERLREGGPIASLRETLSCVMEASEEEMDPTWAKYQLEEIDFFLNTLNIRKDAITFFGDYNNDFKSIFVADHFHFLDDDLQMNESEDDSEEDDDSQDEQRNPRITKCKVCQQFIYKRNFQVEKLAKIFFQVET